MQNSCCGSGEYLTFGEGLKESGSDDNHSEKDERAERDSRECLERE